jgi:hypothetical protein
MSLSGIKDSLPGGAGFWSSPTTEPKRKYRFTFDVAGLPVWTITKVGRPSFTVTETNHVFYNHRFSYPGRVEWDPVSFTIVDPINPDAAGILMKMLYAAGYEFPDKQFGGNGYNFGSINKVDSVDALNPVTITAFDGEGVSVEKWTLKNAFITKVDMGEYEYNSQDMVNSSITLRYDWATLERFDGRADFQVSLDQDPIADGLVGP